MTSPLTTPTPFVIALDGVSGSGKSSTAKAIAQKLGLSYLDTGAMYRALTYFCLEQNIDPSHVKAIASVARTLSFEFPSLGQVIVNGKNLSQVIRTPQVSSQVSLYCQAAEAREVLVDLQRKAASTSNSILDGRDIGTVVFPHTPYKFFIYATPEIRAERRLKELRESGIECTYDEVLQNLIERDEIDKNREISPLKQADDAHLVDTSHMTFDEQVEYIIQKIHTHKPLTHWSH